MLSTVRAGHVIAGMIGRVLLGVIACAPVALTGGCANGRAGAHAGEFPDPIDDLVAANRALGDPHEGRFPLEQALAGLPEGEVIRAHLHTDEGEVVCTLDASHAPLTVANFVGLARGLRTFRGEDGRWRTEPYYVDMPWHRAEAGQFVQTGRRGRLADGGFLIQDEVSPGDDFSRGGVLAMANAGEPHSGSVQFFVTTGPATHLEGVHTIFGRCDQEAVARRLEHGAGDDDPPRLRNVRITRAPRGG